MPSGATTQERTGVNGKSKNTFRADIQGLRAIAVLLVVAYHSGVSQISGGYVGVDVFFVISGFLITGHLLRSLDREGSIRFGAFYAKRARRILPASLFVALITVVASLIWMPPLLMKEVWEGAVATAVYAPNLLFAIKETDYLGESAPSVFQHYWSLGIEEQFYLLWPATLALGFLVFRQRKRGLLGLTAVLTLASFTLCIAGMAYSQSFTFFLLPTRAWELGVGALVAFLVSSDASWLKRPAIGLLAWIGMGLLLVVALVLNSSTPFPGPYAALPVLATALLIVGGGAHSKFSCDRFLGLGVLQFVGKISYSLYLIHWPLQVIPQAIAGPNDPLSLSARLTLGMISLPLAWLLYRFIEQPAMTYRDLAHGRPLQTFRAAVVASGLVIAVAAGAIVTSNSLALSVDRAIVEAPAAESPTGAAFVPSNLEPSLREASDDNPTTYSNGCHRGVESTDASGCQAGGNTQAPLVFLFGDSHAANWHPALELLATNGEIQLDANTKTSCGSVDLPRVRDGSIYGACQEWRDAVIDRIISKKPDLVILANYSKADLAGGNFNFDARWQAGLESTISAMKGIKVVVLSDVPQQAGTPAVCLSSNLNSAESCDGDRRSSVSDSMMSSEQAAANATGARYANMVRYFCNENSCPVIIGNKLVYRDTDHLTASFSRQLADPLLRELQVAIGQDQ